MGCVSSTELNMDEERMRKKVVWKPLQYEEMADAECEQLDTDIDLNGQVEQDKLLVPTRYVPVPALACREPTPV